MSAQKTDRKKPSAEKVVLKKAEQVFLALRDRIIDGKMLPNVFYTEQGIVDEFKVGKATAREALHRLSFSGYMTRHPRKGYSVNMVLGDEFLQIQQLRYAVEGLAIKLVIKNCSDEEIRSLYVLCNRKEAGTSKVALTEMQNLKFHAEIARLSRNEAVHNIVYVNAGISSRAAANFPYLQTTPKEYSHEALVTAMLKRDAKRAMLILRKHFSLDEEGL